MSEVHTAICDMDGAIDGALKFILEAQNLRENQIDQLALPFQTGYPGLGLPKIGPTSHCAFLGYVIASLKIQAELLLSASINPSFSKEVST